MREYRTATSIEQNDRLCRVRRDVVADERGELVTGLSEFGRLFDQAVLQRRASRQQCQLLRDFLRVACRLGRVVELFSPAQLIADNPSLDLHPIRRARYPDVRTREEHPADAVTIPAPPAAHSTRRPQRTRPLRPISEDCAGGIPRTSEP